MNRDSARRRIPTSAELEAEGALAPPEHEASRGPFKLFRARLFRVSDEVGSRKHVATALSPKSQAPSQPAPPIPPEQLSVTPLGSTSGTRRFRVSDEVGARKHVASAPAPPQVPSPAPPVNSAPAKDARPRLFRVSDEVGRRKHVAAASNSRRLPETSRAASTPSTGSGDASQPAAASLRPRPIRISESVRNRRGAGH